MKSFCLWFFIFALLATGCLRDSGLKTKGKASALTEYLQLPPQKMRPGQGTIKLKIHLPAGYKLTANAPSHLEIKSTAEKNIKPLVSAIPLNAGLLEEGVVIPVKVSSGKAAILFDAAVYFCTAARDLKISAGSTRAAGPEYTAARDIKISAGSTRAAGHEYTAGAKACYFKNLKLEVPIEVSPGANPSIELNAEVPKPSARPALLAFQS